MDREVSETIEYMETGNNHMASGLATREAMEEIQKREVITQDVNRTASFRCR